MKKLTLLIVTAIFAVLHVYGVQPVYERIVKLSYPSEKEKKIIDVARKVCDEVAPSYGVDALEAGIYSIDPSEKQPLFGKKSISVRFIDSTDGNALKQAEENGPCFVVMVVMYEDSLEPIMIMDKSGSRKSFLPNGYAYFRQHYPDYRLKPFVTPEMKDGEVILYCN